MKYADTDPYKNVIENEFADCAEKWGISEECLMHQVSKKFVEMTVEGAIDSMTSNRDDDSEALVRFICLCILDLFSPKMRKLLLQTLADWCYQSAALIYLKRGDLTAEEDQLLWGKFAHQMPELVKRLAEGKEKRSG